MNKTAIKSYAGWARVQLIESVKQRAYEYEITDGGENRPNVDTVGGRLLTSEEKRQRDELIAQIRLKGFAQVMEETAYTWFNRFIALRFMEVNGYLPSKVRVFTDENGAFKPEILKEAMNVEIEGLDREKVLELLDKQDNEALYKYLLITQCNALSGGLPYVFEKTANRTELLFPNNILKADGVIGRLISDIGVEDWQDEVEIIGWFYQYYISDKHEEVVDPLHGKIIKKEDIPAATQLFTTDWVVRYILDNSLGRYWIERNPESRLAEKLTYFVAPKDGGIPAVNETLRPEELKVLDPCVGSGHFLTYAFDVLLEIYRECGWSERDAAKSIVENNLYGIDIDDRAAQLACFALMMKARKYNRRIISADTKLHILAMQDSVLITDELIKFAAGNDASICAGLDEIRTVFNNAKEYGSIITVPQLDFSSLYARLSELSNSYAEDLIRMQLRCDAAEYLLPLIQQAEILSLKYDVVATNPPYLNKYSARLKDYISEHYSAYKGDLFSVFMVRNFDFCRENGYSGFMTPNVWMFIKTYEELRNYIIDQKSIITLIQMAKGSFFKEATVDICAFVLSNKKSEGNGLYIRLEDFRGDMEVQKQKALEAIENKDCGYYYESAGPGFSKIPGSPVAYWVSPKLLDIFRNSPNLDRYATPRQGLITGDNNKFLRFWFEVSKEKTSFEKGAVGKWYPINKGGDFRRWYGNQEYIVNWENDGKEILNFKDEHGKLRSRPQNLSYNFNPSVSWSLITSGGFSARFYPDSFMFNVAGICCFPKQHLEYILALMNTKITTNVAQILNPTINMNAGDIAKIPIVIDDGKEPAVKVLTEEQIELSKQDWDSFETSWDFKRHPLVSGQWSVVSGHYARWEKECESRFGQLKANEEELNRIFIDIYGLQDELTPEVEDRDVTVRKADLQRDIKSLISYAVGCMFGRYSLDSEGLAYAGGEWDSSKYITFPADADNIIPICDDDYFDDDITGRFIKWVETVYGKDTLEENLKFIADALGGKGTPRGVIRSYFINDFYSDHCKTYQKRPIYWLFSSGKKNGFKALIYMHRYQPDLLARMRTDYVHEQQERYRTQLLMLEDGVESASPSERVKLNKKITRLKDQALEIQKYEEKIHHLADRMISVDPDDGVKVNYAKFEDVLEKIK